MDGRRKRRGSQSGVTSRRLFYIPSSLSLPWYPPRSRRDPPPFFPFHDGVPRRDGRGSGVERGGERGEGRRRMLIRCRQRRRHQKRVASGSCHQLSSSLFLGERTGLAFIWMRYRRDMRRWRACFFGIPGDRRAAAHGWELFLESRRRSSARESSSRREWRTARDLEDRNERGGYKTSLLRSLWTVRSACDFNET